MPTLTVQTDIDVRSAYPYDSILVLLNRNSDIPTRVERGAELATRHDATLHLLMVVEQGVFAVSMWSNDVVAQLEAEAQKSADEAANVAAATGATGTITAVKKGSVVSEVSSYSSANDIDLLVSGTSLPDRLTARIVRSVPTPVLNVPSE